MLNDILEYMCQLFAVQSKALLTAGCKIVDNAGTFLLDDRLYLLSDICLQCINSTRAVQTDVVLDKPPRGGNLQASEVPILLQLCS